MSEALRFDLAKVAKWAVPLTALSLIMEVVYAADSYRALMFMNKIEAGLIDVDTLTSAAEAIDEQSQMVGIAFLVVLFCAYIANGIWIYRASWNARQLLPLKSRITPGWAVGWFFIPVASLWKPFGAMKETWIASHGSLGPSADRLAWWWAAWVLSNILGQASFRLSMRAETLEQIKTAEMIDLLNSPFSVLAAFLFLRIIKQVTLAQTSKLPPPGLATAQPSEMTDPVRAMS